MAKTEIVESDTRQGYLSNIDDDRSPIAVLWIYVGGVGQRAGVNIERLARLEGRPFAMGSAAFDTDPNDLARSPAEVKCSLAFGWQQLEALKGNAALFRPEVAAILRDYHKKIHAGELQAGSRTQRPLTQLAFELFEDQFVHTMRNALAQVVKRSGGTNVLPVILGSSGGGFGSAAQVIIPLKLSNPAIRSRILLGLAWEKLLPPVLMCVEPFSYMRRSSWLQEMRIGANAMAYRLETDELLNEGLTTLVHHVGFANQAGVVLDESEQMARVLGTTAFFMFENYDRIKNRVVDDLAGNDNCYGGIDLPENSREARRKRPLRGTSGSTPPQISEQPAKPEANDNNDR